ncbi:MAG: hypothetical protein ACC645_15220 [Pirellulales bacterium]
MEPPLDDLELAHHSGSAEDGPPNQILTSLRGRYHWAILSGLLFAAVGAVAGYKVWSPKYQGVGIIRIRPHLERILYEREENQTLPMYDSYVNTQMAMLTSQRLIDLAMQQEEWHGQRRGLSEDAVRDFKQAIGVERPSRGEFIRVTFIDREQDASVAGVKAVIKAFEALVIEADKAAEGERVKELEKIARTAGSRVQDYKERIDRVASNIDADSLTLVYQTEHLKQDRIRTRLDDLEVDVFRLNALAKLFAETAADTTHQEEQSETAETTAKDPASNGSETNSPATGSNGRLPWETAVDRTTMESLIQQESALQLRIEQLLRHASEKNRRVIDAKRDLANVQNLLAPFRERYGELMPSVSEQGVAQTTENGLNQHDNLADVQQKLIAIEAERKKLETQLADSEKRTGDLIRRIEQVNDINSDLEEKRALQRKAQEAINIFKVESSVGKRIQIADAGSKTGEPINLSKRKQLVVLGLMGGLTFGVGIVVMIGLLDRRYRYVSDAQNSIGALPLIGVLPRLPHNLADPEQAGIAAHAVQQIRMQLQLGLTAQQRHVLTVTSPTPGEGKTSLTMALGLSFAASGNKTLLIDFDLHGQGLTRQAECIVRPKIGPLLLQHGMVTMDQLTAGLKRSAVTKRRLGESLVELGVVSKEDVRHALTLQAESSVGLREALRGEPLESCMQATETPQLYLLPVGASGPELIGSLSPSSVGRLLDEARKQFATVIVDTGPVPASTEAALVTSLSDGVLLTVSRGVRKRAAERTIHSLRQFGASVVGVVFNRAKATDMEHSGFSTGVSKASGRAYLPGFEHAREANQHTSSKRFGPVAHAAALALSVTDATTTGPVNGRSDGKPATGGEDGPS